MCPATVVAIDVYTSAAAERVSLRARECRYVRATRHSVGTPTSIKGGSTGRIVSLAERVDTERIFLLRKYDSFSDYIEADSFTRIAVPISPLPRINLLFLN